jgi:hypothetical protein
MLNVLLEDNLPMDRWSEFEAMPGVSVRTVTGCAKPRALPRDVVADVAVIVCGVHADKLLRHGGVTADLTDVLRQRQRGRDPPLTHRRARASKATALKYAAAKSKMRVGFRADSKAQPGA